METDTEYSYARDWIGEMKGIDFSQDSWDWKSKIKMNLFRVLIFWHSNGTLLIVFFMVFFSEHICAS